MEELKEILKKSQIILCYGTNKTNRYDFFKNYINEKYKGLLLQNSLDYTFIFYVNEEENVFYENKVGEWIEVVQQENKDSIKNVYIPIKEKFFSKEFVFIVPPPIENNEIFLEREWEENLYKVIWFDSFPYAQFLDLYFIENLQRRFMKKGKVDFDIAFMEEENKYIDLDSAYGEKAIENSIGLYKKQQIGSNYYRLKTSDEKEVLKDTLLHKQSDIKGTQHYVSYEIYNRYHYFKTYFEQDYEMEINEIITLERLEEVCSHQKWCNSTENSLIRCWLDNSRELILKEAIGVLMESIQGTYFEDIRQDVFVEQSVGELREELQNAMILSWENFQKNISFGLNFPGEISKNIDRLAFLMETKFIRVDYKEKLNRYMKEHLKKDLQKYIERKYKLWKNILKKVC